MRGILLAIFDFNISGQEVFPARFCFTIESIESYLIVALMRGRSDC